VQHVKYGTCVWAILSVCFVGCGGPFTGEVKGRVNFKGKPLPGGIVTFAHPDGRIGQGRIQEDGTYVVEHAPGGEVKVLVATVPPIPAVPSFMLPKEVRTTAKAETIYPAGKYVKIPARYGSQETAFDFTVKRGSQEFNLDLTE
jgi:hypothetical protein